MLHAHGRADREILGGPMGNDNDRMKVAQWVLERNLAWIASAEVKVGVVVAINTAVLAALAAAFGAAQLHDRTPWAYLFTLSAAGASSLAIFCAAMAVMPRLKGPDSLLFFGTIGQHKLPDYADAFRNASDLELLEDCLAQVHRNAEIARDKYAWVRKSMAWSFFCVVPWIFALALLVRT
jgi:hypothetical protein